MNGIAELGFGNPARESTTLVVIRWRGSLCLQSPAWTDPRCTVAGVVVYALGRAWHAAGWSVPVKLVVLSIMYLVLLLLARKLRVEDLPGLKRRL